MKNLLSKLKKRKILITIISIGITFFILIAVFLIALLPLNTKSLKILQILVNPTPQLITEYINNYSTTENTSQLNMIVNEEYVTNESSFEKETLIDTEYIKDYTYKLPGKNGSSTLAYYTYEYSWLGFTGRSKVLKEKVENFPVSEKTYTGTKNLEEIQNIIRLNFQKIISLLKEENHSEVSNYFSQPLDITIKDKSILDNIEVKDIKFHKDTYLKKDTKLVSGTIFLYLSNCKINIEENLIYDFELKKWELENSNEFIQRLCIPQFISRGDKFIGTCSDCTLFPANKRYGMRSDYIPPVIAFELQTNVYVHARIHGDLKDMFTDARNAGHSILINSAYRSYETQVNTFEAWVQMEMNSGKDRASAELAANSYSALPGFSEHQLGTAIDLVTTQCSNFGHGCGPSEALWQWLKDNAYRYGFALSYPINKESLTGYVYEPWHWRWIGKELAAEFKQIEVTTTLQEFLFNKNQY